MQIGAQNPFFSPLLFGSVVVALGAQPTLPTRPPGWPTPQLQEGVCVPASWGRWGGGVLHPGAGVEEARQGPGGLGSSVRGTPKAQAASARGSA